MSKSKLNNSSKAAVVRQARKNSSKPVETNAATIFSYASEFSIVHGLNRLMFHEFDVLEEHRYYIANHFEKRIVASEKKFKREMAKFEDEFDQAEYADHALGRRFSIEQEMPNLQWQAQLLVVYATFERQLNQVCELVRRRSELTVGVTDFHGQGIARASNYLQKIAGVVQPFRTSAWTKATQLGRVRNVIAHNGGLLKKEDKDGNAAAKQLDVVSKVGFADGEFAIDISPELVAMAIKVLRQVMTDVGDYELYKPRSVDA